jgi:RND family efflux transporter MFP subunit
VSKILRAECAIVAALLTLAACGKDPAQGATPAGQGGGGDGRRANSITLAPSDLAPARRAPIEEATAITGDLNPIESVEIRARLEGDIESVLVREGQRVTRGQLLARFDATEQESAQRSAEADRVAAQTELGTAQWNLEQTEELFKQGAVPERDLKASQQAVAAARARVAAAEARLHSSAVTLRDTRVVAPTDGIVAKRTVENGEHVGRGASLFTVVRNDVLELAAMLPARRAGAVAVGQTVRFTADGRAFDGRVARVSPTIDPATRSVTVYVQVPNPTGALKGGTFATGRVVARSIPDALVIPAPAVRQAQQGGKPFVYRVVNNTIDVAPITLGVVDEAAALAQVLDGLSPGDRVIVGNIGALGKGMAVEVLGGENTRGSRAQDSGGKMPGASPGS